MNSDNSFWYFIGGLIGFIAGIFITRAVFSIPTLVNYQTKQYQLLKLMAEKLGVDEDEILKVHNIDEYNIKMKRLQREAEEAEEDNSN